MNKNIAMICEVAKGLGKLKDKMVFVGGATVGLYLDLDVASEVRPTEDVDVVIEVNSRIDYEKLSKELRSLNFINDITKGAPICRWKYLGIIVDVMPTNEKVLGFSNPHSLNGIKYSQVTELPDGQHISIFTLGYFLASKLEAFFNRGINSPLFSSDLEDIVAILSDAKDFDSLFTEQTILPFLKESFLKIQGSESIIEAMNAFTTGGVSGQHQVNLQRIKQILISK